MKRILISGCAAVFAAGILLADDLENSLPLGMSCPYCSGSFALPDGWWSENWTIATYTTIQLKDKDGVSVGTAIIDIGKKNANNKVPVKVYVLQFLDQTQCIAADKLCPIDNDGNVVIKRGTVDLKITSNGKVSGTVNGYRVNGDTQGDDAVFEHGSHVFKVEVGDYSLNAPYRLVNAALPVEVVVVTRKTGNWNCGNAITLKYKKNKSTGTYELSGLNNPTKPNTSRLTLKLNARKDTFSGSFRAYATNEDGVAPGKMPKLKSYSFKVSGTIEGGVGVGTATCKALKASWSVVIE